MIVKLLTEHHLEFVSLKGGCRGSSESTHVKMPHCWKSHGQAQLIYGRINHHVDNKTSLNTKLSKQIGKLCEPPHGAPHVLFSKLFGPESRIPKEKLST